MSGITADSVVVTCMDLRLQKRLASWIEENNLYTLGHDRVALAGAGGDMKTVMEQVRMSVKLHGTKQVRVINHQNCGYYPETLISGSEEELARHLADLSLLKKQVKEEFPEAEFHGYFLSLNGQIKELDLI